MMSGVPGCVGRGRFSTESAARAYFDDETRAGRVRVAQRRGGASSLV